MKSILLVLEILFKTFWEKLEQEKLRIKIWNIKKNVEGLRCKKIS